MSMNAVARILHYPLEVDDRLAELGLAQAHLWSALAAGLQHKVSLTDNNTAAIRGIGTWDAIHMRLREQLRPLGWLRDEPGNFATTVHPSGGHCIAVLSGDGATGHESLRPTNRHPKRKRMRAAIKDNEVAVGRQRHFGQLAPAQWQGLPRVTYFLLHHIDEDTRTIQAELSLPVALSSKFVTEWHERIILTPPAYLTTHMPVTSPQDDNGDLDIEVPVIDLSQQAS